MHIGIDGIDAESKGKKIKPTRNRQVFLMDICLPHQKNTGEYLLIFPHNVDCHWIAHLNSMSFYVLMFSENINQTMFGQLGLRKRLRKALSSENGCTMSNLF